MHNTLLRDVQMDTAVPQSTGQSLATEVEQCVCPPGYIGLSCEVKWIVYSMCIKNRYT